MSDLSLKHVTGAGVSPAAGKTNVCTSSADEFKNMLKKSIDSVSADANKADKLADGLISGKHANIHETMIAMEKANISFRLMTKTQGMIIRAYQEVIKIPL
ncbi:MAG: flagellar hook-basal body complex protein FliE [Thermodesulfobacteriota bacterium]|nr:flagellar hook-basal body complex protein FliE [Thermodesulfobacteriota bacterium]